MTAAVVGAGLGAVSSLLNTSAQNQSIENQAVALEARADSTRKEGAEQANLISSQTDPLTGQVTASAAGSGVETGTGSVLDTIQQNAFNIEMDALLTAANASSQASAYEADASALRSSKKSGISALLSAGGAGLSGYAAGAQVDKALK